MPLYRAELIRRKKPLIGPQLHDVSQVLYLPFDKDHEPYSVEPYDPTQVLRLPFEDPPQEITYDRSGYGNNGAIYGAARVIGKVRNALKFDGVDDYVKVEDNPSLRVNGDLTISDWIYPLSLPVGEASIITKHYLKEFEFLLRGDGELRLYHGDGVGETMTSTGAGITINKWFHVAVTRTMDPKEVKFYVNGDLITTSTFTRTPIAGTDYVSIGARAFEKVYWLNAIIDEMRIYNRALSQAEIKRLMNLGGV